MQHLVLLLLVPCALVGCARPAPSPAGFDFLEGTWTTVKDGLSLTLAVAPHPEGGWHEAQWVDDGNARTTTAILRYDAASDTWTRTLTLPNGDTSTFVGTATDSGAVVLEQRAYAGRPIDPPQARLVYTPKGTDRFVLDWQSRGENDVWIPRASPFKHTRVQRPPPPTPPGRIAFISRRDGNWEVYTMKPDGSDLRNLSTHPSGDHFPRWLAGGTRLAFRSQRDRSDDGWSRWEMDADGTDAAPVALLDRLNNPDFGLFPTVHPTGSYVVNAAEREGEQDLYVWRFDGGGERVVAPAPGLDYRPLFSPDGTRILFISERDGNAEVYTVAFDGSDLQRLTQSPGIDRYARWSPDGTQIGFVSDRDGDMEVFVMDTDGSNVRQLTFNDAEDGEISWSPDSRYLAYRSDASGNGEIHVLDVATGITTNVTRHEAYDGEPVWSPAG